MSTSGPSKKHAELLSEEQQAVLKQKGAEIEQLQTDITSLSRPLVSSGEDWTKHVTPGTLSVFQEESSWDRLSIKPDSGLLKKNNDNNNSLKAAASTSWRKMQDALALGSSDEGGEHDDSLSEEEELSPIATKFDQSERKTYGARPMEEEPVVVQCKACQRPILASSFPKHAETCSQGMKKPRALTMDPEQSKMQAKGIFSDDEDNEDEPSAKKRKQADKVKMETDAIDPSNIPAKRPPSAIEKPEKKKPKKEKVAKPKATPRQKAPLDLDKQCGVIQGPNNLPCTRSLTCKTHSMGAKRAVAGRSQPYDVLLAAYQKKAIGRPQSSGASATDRKGTTVSAKATKASTKKTASPIPGSSSSGTGAATTGGPHGESGPNNEETFVNSDEEVENVMQAVRQSCPAPLAEKPFYFVKRRRQCYRLRDVLLDTITPKSPPPPPPTPTTVLQSDPHHLNNQQQQQQQQQTSFYENSMHHHQQHHQQHPFQTSAYPPPPPSMQQTHLPMNNPAAAVPSGMIGFSSGSMEGAMFNPTGNTGFSVKN